MNIFKLYRDWQYKKLYNAASSEVRYIVDMAKQKMRDGIYIEPYVDMKCKGVMSVLPYTNVVLWNPLSTCPVTLRIRGEYVPLPVEDEALLNTLAPLMWTELERQKEAKENIKRKEQYDKMLDYVSSIRGNEYF